MMGKVNGFSLFLQEQRRLNPNLTDQELMVHCDSLWRERQRRKWEASGSYKQQGRSVAEILKSNREREKEDTEKIEAVRKMVEMAAILGDLETKIFYVMQTNVFLKTDEYPEPEVIVPAEISICRFSLMKGVMDIYQAFPEPGDIPLGYKRICLENSEKVHRVPLKENTAESRDFLNQKMVEFVRNTDVKIMEDISLFLAETRSVFCMPEFTGQCKGVLRTLAHRSNTSPLLISFLSLPMLLCMLGNSSKVGSTLPSINIAEAEFEKERFMFHSGLSCPWHEAMTDSNNCSSASVRRWCFTVLDLCCQHYNIPLVSGKHIPVSVETGLSGQDWGEEGWGTCGRRGVVGGRNIWEERGDEEVSQTKGVVIFGKVVSDEPQDEVMIRESTLSDYLSNLSLTSQLDLTSQTSQQGEVVVKKGRGRGAVVLRRRLAANFTGCME